MPSTPSEPGAGHGLSDPHEDWERTPASVRTLVSDQQETIAELLKQDEELFKRNCVGSTGNGIFRLQNKLLRFALEALPWTWP